MAVVAKITDKDAPKIQHIFKINDIESIWQHLEHIVGEEIGENGISVYIEASSWCEIATVGEEFDHEKFVIEIAEEGSAF